MHIHPASLASAIVLALLAKPGSAQNTTFVKASTFAGAPTSDAYPPAGSKYLNTYSQLRPIAKQFPRFSNFPSSCFIGVLV